MAECSVRVICRFRPFNEREKKEMGSVDNSKSGVAITFPSDQSVNIKTPENPKQVFNLDFIFDSNKSQDFIYQHGVAVAAEDIMKGVNATIFAYGQTGAGKTFTMFGPDDYVPHPQLWGVVPRACTFIFDKINSSTDDSVEYSAKGSFVEVYNEKIRDLLDTRNDDLKVRESPAKGIYIEGVKEEPLCSSEDVWALLALGDKAKAKAATAMNARSSRSHSVFILRLEQIQAAGGSKVSRLNLVDLAGSERISKTGAAGSVLEEAKNINKSLSALGNCISALTTGSGHVPFRDSQLTRLLQDSLQGNTKTIMIVCCSPAAFNVEETIGTLRFAARAKLIKNVVKANVQRSASELEKMLEMLEKDMKAMKIYVAQLEATVEWMKGPNYKPGAEPPVKATRPSCLQGGGGDVGGEGDSFVESASRQLASAAASSNTAAELATLKAQLEVALERQGELEEENKVLNLQLKEKAEECESKVASAEREVQEALEDKKRAEFMNNQAQLQCDELRNEAKTLAKSNDELKKLLHEMQSQANQSGAVAKLEMEVVELLEKLEETKRLAASSEERLAVLEQELSDYKELNDLLEIDNANANGRADQMTVVVENLRRQAAERAAELQRMQDATRGGDSALEKELAASLQVITKLEADINASRSQTDDVKLAMASLEKQLENSSARLAESDAKMKALVVEHTEKVAALSAKLEEASRKAKENASKGTSADVNTFTLEILELRRDLESRTAKSISQLKQMESLALRISDLEESQTQAKKEAFELEDKFEAAKFEKELLLQEKAQMDALVEELQQQLTRLPLQQRARFAKAAAKASTSDKVEFGQHMLRATGGREDGDVKDGAAAAGGGGA